MFEPHRNRPEPKQAHACRTDAQGDGTNGDTPRDNVAPFNAHRPLKDATVDTPSSLPWDRPRDGRILAVLLILVWGVYLTTATYDVFQINDNRATAISAWSVAARGTLALPEDWLELVAWTTENADGQVYTDRFPGIIFVTVPAYLVAVWFGLAPEPSHPLYLNFAPAGVTAATVAATAVGAMYVVFRRLTGRRTATVATLIFAFGTASWSINADSIWTHGLTTLGIALGMLAMSSDKHLGAGAAFAVSILARPQTAVVPAVVGIWRGIARRSLRPVATVGLFSALGLLGVSIYSQLLFGTWLPIAGYDPVKVEAIASSSLGLFAERWAYTLAHRERGVLFYTPVLLVLVPFVHRGWRIAPEWVRSSAIAGLVYLAVQLRSNTWDGGAGFFGSRLTIETLVLAAPLLLCTWQAIIRRDRLLRAIFSIFAVLSLALHAVGATVLSIQPSSRETLRNELATMCDAEQPPDECSQP
jgi:hypothetical protein